MRTRVYICSHHSPTCVPERVGACFCASVSVRLLYVRLSFSGLIYICQCVHMFGSETGWMQHSLRSLQCQAIPGGYEHLVNRLWPLRRPCFLTSIAVQRLLSTSVVNVKSLLLEQRELRLWMQSFGEDARLGTSNVPHIKFKDITKCCLLGEIENGFWHKAPRWSELDIIQGLGRWS